MSLTGVVIQQNQAGSLGGGIYQHGQAFDLANSIVALNQSGAAGGGVYADSCWGDWHNNTVDRNSAVYLGGNIYLSTAVSMDIRDNLVTYGVPHGFQASAADNITFQYNGCYGNIPADIAGLTPDITNTSTHPHYADTTDLDYRLALHSGGIDSGDPAGNPDPDGSTADRGAFGGPDIEMLAPEYVKNLSATALNDTTIHLTWDQIIWPGGISAYAVYGSTDAGFVPAESLYLGSVGGPANSFDHHPVGECWYYRVSAVASAGYAGGYSAEDSACVSGIDTEPPAVTVTAPNGGEEFEPGDTVEIGWIASDNQQVDSISIYYSLNGGALYLPLAGGEPNDSLYTWIAPDVNSDSCLVRVVAYDPVLLTGEDVSGRLVRVLVEETRKAGGYEETWNGQDRFGRQVASGVYFYRLTAGRFVQTRKMILLR